MTGNVPLVPDPVRVNGFAGALPLPAPLSGDVSLSPDPVRLSEAQGRCRPHLEVRRIYGEEARGCGYGAV